MLWATQLFGHMAFDDSFPPFSDETILIVLMGICAFLVGCFFARFTVRRVKANELSGNKAPPAFVNLCLKILLPGYVLVFAIPQVLAYAFQPAFLPGEIREALVSSVVENDRGTVVILYAHYLAVFMSLLAISYESNGKRSVLFFLVLTGLMAALLTFGRTMLLLFFVSSGVVLYIQKVISKKLAVVIAIVFVILFFSLAYLLGKGGTDGGWLDNVLWNFQVYILGGVAALNHFVITGQPDIDGYLLVPNFLKEHLGLLGSAGDVTPNVLPFVEAPFPVNVYTSLFPWYHDAGLVGIVLGFFTIGFGSMYFFRTRYRSRLSLFIYSLSLYPVLMTVFEEQYLRAYTMWVLVFILFLLVFVSGKIERENFRKIAK